MPCLSKLCPGSYLHLILNIPLLRSGVMQVVFIVIMLVVFIAECKSCEINNQFCFNVMFPFSKTKDKLVTR